MPCFALSLYVDLKWILCLRCPAILVFSVYLIWAFFYGVLPCFATCKKTGCGYFGFWNFLFPLPCFHVCIHSVRITLLPLPPRFHPVPLGWGLIVKLGRSLLLTSLSTQNLLLLDLFRLLFSSSRKVIAKVWEIALNENSWSCMILREAGRKKQEIIWQFSTHHLRKILEIIDFSVC